MLSALVSERLGLPGSPPREITLLSHKIYSRELQRRLVPEATAAFAPLDPARPEVAAFPVFVKPVKGTMSIRAQLVRNREELAAAVRFTWKQRIRARLLLRPYQQLLDRYSDGRVPSHHFVAEEPLQGEQVTVDGFVQHGRVTIMGVVDSVMYPGTMSFERFEYPSRLPPEVKTRMGELVTRLIEGSGLESTCFNVELFHDRRTDRLHVIEINPRMSYQFGDLYERVDGTHTYEVQLALAVGEPAPWQAGAGVEGTAASFVMRRFTDAKVLSVPSPELIAEAHARFPGASVKPHCLAGEQLSNNDQDVGSFRYCIVNLGAKNTLALHASYAQLRALIPFEFDPAADPKAPLVAPPELPGDPGRQIA
jgi:biotin carboxylase